MESTQSYQMKAIRFPLMLRNALFPSLSDKEITAKFLYLAEQDYVLEDFCSFIKEKFEPLLSISDDCNLSMDEKQAFCGMAGESIVIAGYNDYSEIAVLVCLMFCCFHNPEDWVHGTCNIDVALKIIFEYCFLTEDEGVLNILNEASWCFAMYYMNAAFLEAVVIYICTCRLLGKEPAYKEIAKNRNSQDKRSCWPSYEHLIIERDFVYENFLSRKSFRKPAVNTIDFKNDFEIFLEAIKSKWRG